MTKTSLTLSKKLAKGGCKIESEFLQDNLGNIYTNTMPRVRLSDGINHDGTTVGVFYLAYDLLWDICIKHVKEFFGEEKGMAYDETGNSHLCETPLPPLDYKYRIASRNILSLLQQNKIQEAEDYIWEHCKFNPKNK